jgi:AcrR family transcriptional regulator
MTVRFFRLCTHGTSSVEDAEPVTQPRQRTYRGATADERRTARREALIEAGLDVIGESGWNGLSLKAVCERAGLTERYFYESFAGLSAFRGALVDLVAGETEDALVGAMHAQGSQRTVIERIVTAVWRLLLDDPRRGRVAAMDGLDDLSLLARRRSILSGFAELVAERSEEVFGLGADDPASPIIAAAFVGAVDEVFRRLLAGELTGEPSEAARVTIDIFSDQQTWPI